MLVLARRASSRILKPAAATRLQQAWCHARDERTRRKEVAAVKLQASERSWRARIERKRAVSAAITLQAVARRRHARSVYTKALSALHPPLVRIQAGARAYAARSRLQKAGDAAKAIQSSWRMVRSKVLAARLHAAAARLRGGSVLSKYRAGGRRHERHDRFVFVSKDLQKLCWAPSAAAADCCEVKHVAMSTITAVSAGCKTSLMKKMEKRCRASSDEGELPRTMSFQRAVSLRRGRAASRALPLDGECAFSLISRDRVLDFVTADASAQRRWLKDLRTVLLYSHHLDHNAAVHALQAASSRCSLSESAAAAA